MYTCIEDMRGLNDHFVPAVDIVLEDMSTNMSDPSPRYFYERFVEMLTAVSRKMSSSPQDTRRLRSLHLDLWSRACRCRREWLEEQKKSQPPAETMDVASPWTREQRLQRVNMTESDWSDAEKRILEIDGRSKDWVPGPCTALERCYFPIWTSMRTLARIVGLPMGKDDVEAAAKRRTVTGEGSLSPHDLRLIDYHMQNIDDMRLKIETGGWKDDWDL